MAEITPLVNSYCQHFKNKEQLRKQSTEVTKDLKEAHEKLKEEMSRADLRIIRSLSCGYDIKLYSKLKKPTQSVKNLRKIMEKYEIAIETIDSIMSDIQTGKEETSQIIKLIPLNRTKADTTVLS
jgi:predicted HAD superfamily phosphohydrolase YqeG